jgi:hypothetical protein
LNAKPEDKHDENGNKLSKGRGKRGEQLQLTNLEAKKKACETKSFAGPVRFNKGS